MAGTTGPTGIPAGEHAAFAPHSFTFAHHWLPWLDGGAESRKFWFNGCLTYNGPTSPRNGSFPALTVSLHNGTGWFYHT